jgi:glycosyltransferase involved in cell wall biosynthesis
MTNELVSIITPMYNAARFVGQAIESVLAQAYPRWEMLVVDDGSRDNSYDIAMAYAKKDSRINVLRQDNAGSAAARNRALSRAQGRYIVFLDADDLLYASFLGAQIAFMKEKGARLVFASYDRVDEQGNACLRPFMAPEKVSYKQLLTSSANAIPCLTAMYDAEKVGKYYFRPELKSLRDDYAMWLEMLKKEDYAYGNPAILAAYRCFASSTTGAKKKIIIPHFKVYYKVEKLGLARSMYYLLRWCVSGFFKYRK